jgi:hypothetical protein
MRAFAIWGAALALLAALWPAAAAWGWTDPITPGSITISLHQFNTPGSINVSADGTPQDFVSAGDGSGQVYVPLRDGKIDVFSSSGQLLSTYLNMTSPSVGLSIYTGGEGGLLGMAFSPNFNAPASTPGSGKFYTFDTEPVCWVKLFSSAGEE